MVSASEFLNRQIQLPLFGTVGVTTLAVTGLAAWFIFLRPRKTRTTKTTVFR